MEECIHRTWIPSLPAKVNRYFSARGISDYSRKKKVVKSEIKPGLPFMIPAHVHKFQRKYSRGTCAIEQMHIRDGRTNIYRHG